MNCAVLPANWIFGKEGKFGSSINRPTRLKEPAPAIFKFISKFFIRKGKSGFVDILPMEMEKRKCVMTMKQIRMSGRTI